MHVGSKKVISRRFCNPLCCSTKQFKESRSSESKESSESIYTSQYINCNTKQKQNWITDNWSSIGELEIGIQTISSDSYFIEKALIGVIKLDFCLKKYILNLKVSFIKVFNMDNSTRELHKEASIRVITKCVDFFLKKNIIWSLEMLKWNFEQKKFFNEYSNKLEAFNSLECVKFADGMADNKKYALNSDIKEIGDDNVLSEIDFDGNIENGKLNSKNNVISVNIAQWNDEFFKDQNLIDCSETILSSIESRNSDFNISREYEKGGIILSLIISRIILKEKSNFWSKIAINYYECHFKESRIELLRNAKIKIKRGKFQIASNLVKSNMLFVELKIKQWAICKMKNLLYTYDNSGGNSSSETLESMFPFGVITNIPFLKQNPFVDLAVKSAIHN